MYYKMIFPLVLLFFHWGRNGIAQEAINDFPKHYEKYWLTGMCQKLGLSEVVEGDLELVNELLDVMDSNKADFTLTFYHLSNALMDSTVNDQAIRDLFENSKPFEAWAERWRDRLATEYLTDEERQTNMHKVNPLYIARNHLVEAVVRAAEDNEDYAPFYEMLDVLKQPFTEQVGKSKYGLPPQKEEVVLRTFCGT